MTKNNVLEGKTWNKQWYHIYVCTYKCFVHTFSMKYASSCRYKPRVWQLCYKWEFWPWNIYHVTWEAWNMVVRCKNKLHDQTSSARCLNAVNVCVTISVTNTRCFTCSVITFYEALMLNMVLQTINASLCQFCQTRCFSFNLHAQDGPI